MHFYSFLLSRFVLLPFRFVACFGNPGTKYSDEGVYRIDR